MLIVSILAALLGLASLIAGIVCLVRYAQTRQTLFLVLGLLLTFILPGMVVCCALSVWIPSVMVTYGPPPPTLRP